jgi:hypothetical protein
MSLVETIARDLTAAMKAQDAARTSTLRMARAALQNREIEKRVPLDDADVVKVLQGLIKQREDAAEQYERAGRAELAARERAEIDLLRVYVPAEASAEEITAAVEQAVAETGAASPRDLGRVMKAAMASLTASGKAVDGKKVSEAARQRLHG